MISGASLTVPFVYSGHISLNVWFRSHRAWVGYSTHILLYNMERRISEYIVMATDIACK